MGTSKKKEEPKVIVMMGAYNEEKNIGPIVKQVINKGYKCIVVDDGSTDKTSEVSISEGATVIRHILNLGQGCALLTGFKAALMEESKIIIEMDADGQHDPVEIPKFVNNIISSEYDIIVGSRILGTNYSNAPFFRRFFLPYYTWLINKITGYNLTDSMCGFRAFKTKSLRKVHPVLDRIIEPEYIAAEMFIRFARAGLTVSELPVHLKNRNSGTSYKGFFRYGFGILKAISRVITK